MNSSVSTTLISSRILSKQVSLTHVLGNIIWQNGEMGVLSDSVGDIDHQIRKLATGLTTTVLPGKGLGSRADRCFLNSILQCLTHCPFFVSYAEKFPGVCQKDCNFCSFVQHIRAHKSKEKVPSISPKYSSHYHCKGDSPFLTRFVDYLAGRVSDPWTKGYKCAGEALLRWKAFVSENFTQSTLNEFDSYFNAFIRTTRYCSCGAHYDDIKAYTSLPISPRTHGSVEQALIMANFADEKIIMDCHECDKKYLMARNKVIQAPNILLVENLDYEGPYITGQLFNINLTPHFDDQLPADTASVGVDVHYELVSAIVFISRMRHYKALTKYAGNTWQLFDDETVQVLSREAATSLLRRAKLLFYVAKGGLMPMLRGRRPSTPAECVCSLTLRIRTGTQDKAAQPASIQKSDKN